MTLTDLCVPEDVTGECDGSLPLRDRPQIPIEGTSVLIDTLTNGQPSLSIDVVGVKS